MRSNSRRAPAAALEDQSGNGHNSVLSVVGLFSGIGGFELGFEKAGHRTEVLCEILPPARDILSAAQKREDEHRAFEDSQVLTDVKSPGLARKLPERFNLLAAGFPCQDLSQAGRTAGIDGPNSSLVDYLIKILEARKPCHRPRWIVLENVPFMRQLEKGRAMRAVLSALSALDYSWAYREIDTLAFGLPQRRKRLFILACRRGEGDPRSVLLTDNTTPPKPKTGAGWLEGRACGFYWTEGNGGIGWADNAVPPLKGGSGVGIPSPPAIVLPDSRLAVPTIRDAERLQGFPVDWTLPAQTKDGRTKGIRWKLVGNAVSVPVATWIGECLGKSGQPYDGNHDLPMSSDKPWPRAGWRMSKENRRYSATEVTDWPVEGRPRMTLMEVLEMEGMKAKPLSLRAASGFLSRFRVSSLLTSTPEHRKALLRVLEKHVNGAVQVSKE